MLARTIVGSVVFTGILLAADGACAKPPLLLDVNDVSILFARASDGSPVPDLRADASVPPGGQLWNQADFDRVVAFAENGAPGVQGSSPGIGLPAEIRALGAWRAVAMRFDPCAPTSALNGATAPIPGLPPVITGCIVQVRVIVQPFRAQGGRQSDQDFTAHLVFNLPPDTSGEAANDLREIKKASLAAGHPTAGVPLGVHPALAAEALVGTSRPVSDGVSAFVKKWAARAASRSISFMGLRSGQPEPWIFFAGRVAPAWTPSPIPVFGGPPAVLHQRLSFVEAQHVNPPAPQSPSTTPLFQDTTRRDAALVFGVEHPRDHHFFDTDCVSCHTSTALIVSRAIRSDPVRARVAKGVTGYAAREVLQGNPDARFGAFGATWNLRNFGYFNGQPTVSLRTVAETAAVVELVNLTVIPAAENPSRLPGPGRDCTAKDDSVFDCLVHQGGGNACLAACGPLLSADGP